VAFTINQIVSGGQAATGSPPTCTLSSVAAGSAIYVVVGNSNDPVTGASDPSNGGYAFLDSIGNVGGLYYCYTMSVSNAVAGTYTVTPTTASGWAYAFIFAIEVGGVTTSPIDGHTAGAFASVNAGTNSISIGPPSPNNANTPAGVLGVVIALQNSSPGLSAGTGYTAYGSQVPASGSLNNAVALPVYALLASGVSSAVNFSSTSFLNEVLACVAIFDQASGGFSPGYTPPVMSDMVLLAQGLHVSRQSVGGEVPPYPYPNPPPPIPPGIVPMVSVEW
jgi:hypothetical protein